MIDAQVDTIVQDFGYRLQMQGMGLEQYLKMTGTEMGAFRAMFQSQAERQVKTRLALQKVVELEGITVSGHGTRGRVSLRWQSSTRWKSRRLRPSYPRKLWRRSEDLERARVHQEERQG